MNKEWYELKVYLYKLWYRLGLNDIPKIYIPLSMISIPFIAALIYQLIKY